MLRRQQSTSAESTARKSIGVLFEAEPDRERARKTEQLRAEQEQEMRAILLSVMGTAVHLFGPIRSWFSDVTDPRDQNRITYPLASLLWAGCLMFLCRMGSRRQIGETLRNDIAGANFDIMFGVEGVPHGDTLEKAFRRMDPDEGQEAVVWFVDRLIRKKVLDRYRVLGRYFVVVVDGTGYLTFDERHCPSCLTKTHKGGKVTYYHTVLEAKLVTANGLSISLMTEFVENPEPNPTKQDCELKAFYRLATRLKARFPRLPLLLSLDGLFAGGPTFQLCADFGWRFMVVLQDGDLASVHRAFDTLWPEQAPNAMTFTPASSPTTSQRYTWVNDILYTDSQHRSHHLSMLVCTETATKPDGSVTTTTFKWVTNCSIRLSSAVELATDAGRVRWKIENEGFNVQKNGGYDLEHAYTTDLTSAKIFYFLLQIAHLIAQLVWKGDLLSTLVRKPIGSAKNLAMRLLEALRNTVLASTSLDRIVNTRFQIRFDSS